MTAAASQDFLFYLLPENYGCKWASFAITQKVHVHSSDYGFYRTKNPPNIPKMLVSKHLRRKSWLQQQSCAEPAAPSSSRKLDSHLPAQAEEQCLSHASRLQQTQGQDLVLAGCACFLYLPCPQIHSLLFFALLWA